MLSVVGATLFGVLKPARREMGIRYEVTRAAMEALRDGEFADILHWIALVQMRGLEDFAISEPKAFTTMWCDIDMGSVWRKGGAAWHLQDLLMKRENLDQYYFPIRGLSTY